MTDEAWARAWEMTTATLDDATTAHLEDVLRFTQHVARDTLARWGPQRSATIAALALTGITQPVTVAPGVTEAVTRFLGAYLAALAGDAQAEGYLTEHPMPDDAGELDG